MKDLKYYLSLNYPVIIIKNDDDTFFAEIPDLKGCMTDSASDPNEAYKQIQEAKIGWLKTAIKYNLHYIPEPGERELIDKIRNKVKEELNCNSIKIDFVLDKLYLIIFIKREQKAIYYNEKNEIKKYISFNSQIIASGKNLEGLYQDLLLYIKIGKMTWDEYFKYIYNKEIENEKSICCRCL